MKNITQILICTILFFLPTLSEAQGCTGTYNNGYGLITFQQVGNNVTATYDAPGEPGSFTGTMVGTTLSGTWAQGGNRGRIRFDFTHDFSSFEAFWGYNDDPLTNPWGKAIRESTPSKTAYCFNLYHLGLLMGGLEMGAYESYNSTWMTATIDYALVHIRTTNCLSDTYLVDLRRRIQGYDNTNPFLSEIRAYKDRLVTEIETSCSCCMSCEQ